MRLLIATVFIAALNAASALQAQHSQVVVELFTSQGCSSCPDADKLLTELSQRDDVIALALHVDYWDYLGWADEFASKFFSNRQRGYASAAHKSTLYTPQMVVQGSGRAVGSKRSDVKSLIRHYSNRAEPVELDVRRSGNVLTVNARAIAGGVGPMDIQLVRYLPERIIEIKGGENAGRRIVYSNIVTVWKPLGTWNGTGEVSARSVVSGVEPIVVLVQSRGFGPIIAARKLP